MSTIAITPAQSIQTNIDTIAAAGGGVLVLGSGTYTVSSTIVFASGGTPYSNITLRGEPGAKIVPSSTLNSKMFDLGSGSGAASRIRFENITFDMSTLTGSPTNSYVIYGDQNADIGIIDCRIFNSVFGAYLIDQTRLEFIGNEVAKDVGFSPAWGLYWGFFLAGSKGAVVRRNKAHNNPLDGIKFGTASVVGAGTVTVTQGSATVTTSGTSLSSADIGKVLIVIDGSGNSYSGTITNVTGSPAQLTLREAWVGPTLSNNGYFIAAKTADLVDAVIAENVSTDNAQDGINVDSGALHNVVIVDNVVRDNTGYGMHVKQVFEGSEFRRVLLTSNVFSNNHGGGVNVQVNDTTPEPIAGTVGVSSGTVTGSGTKFLANMWPGRVVSTTGGSGVVSTITSDTSMTTTGLPNIGSGATLSYLPENRGMCIFDNQFEIYANTNGIRLHRVKSCLVAGNRFVGVAANSRGILMVDAEDARIRGNVFETDNDCILFHIQTADGRIVRTIVEQNVLASRAGQGIYFIAGDRSSTYNAWVAYISDTIIRHNEVYLKTGSGQWSSIEQAASTGTIRYMNSLGYATTLPSSNGIKGDVCWNSDPSYVASPPGTAEPIGWVCTTSGASAGSVVWKSFGAIV